MRYLFLFFIFILSCSDEVRRDELVPDEDGQDEVISSNCTDGEQRCSIDLIVECIDGDWITVEDCSEKKLTCSAADSKARCAPEKAMVSNTDTARIQPDSSPQELPSFTCTEDEIFTVRNVDHFHSFEICTRKGICRRKDL